ncbi:hypothetical protein WBG78_23125 [Chryseolinea sp. T2]|uniref:hypothetical protein n=1 Tax=Chryseolinea sp. T2 TaxID=3129255 RepID=UPI003076FB0D
MLATCKKVDFQEIWIEGHGESALCVITNATSVFLMYLRHEGDSGFRSNNVFGNESKEQEFRLSNGQVDLYPESWLIDKRNMESALMAYFDSGTMDTSIDWVKED